MKLFIMDVLSLCVNLKYNIAHMIYGWTLYHCNYVSNILMEIKNTLVKELIQLILTAAIHRNCHIYCTTILHV